jgi:hypothetical protein
MVFRAICLCLLLCFYESGAQNKLNRVLVACEGSFNLLRERELLSGFELLDRTHSSLVGGVTVSYSLQKSVKKFDPYVGISYSWMRVSKKLAVDPSLTLTPFWDKYYLGMLYTFAPQLGCRVWVEEENEKSLEVAVDAALAYSTNWYRGKSSEDFFATNTLGFRLGFVARYPIFQFSPFVLFNAVPTLRREYSWVKGTKSGDAITRHGRVLVGFQLGVCF